MRAAVVFPMPTEPVRQTIFMAGPTRAARS